MELTIRDLVNFENATRHSVGINVLLSVGRDPVCSFCIVKKLSKSIDIVKQGKALTAEGCFAEVGPLLKTGVRLHVNFCGDGILIKEFAAGDDFEKVITRVFPFLKADELFSQLYHSPNASYATVCKKELLDEQFATLAPFVYSRSLGPFIISSILSILPDKNIQVDGYSIAISEGFIRVIDADGKAPLKAEIKVGSDYLNDDVLLAYASAIHVLLPAETMHPNADQVVPPGRMTFHFYRQLFVLARITLLATLFIMLVSTVLQLWIQDEVGSLTEQVTTLSKKDQINSALNSQLEKIDKTYHAIGWSKNILPLYYSDQLAQTMPTNLELTLMEVGTLDDRRLKEKRDLQFLGNHILLKGKTQSPIGLQNWINEIEKLDWVAGTSDRTYEFDARENLGKFEFLIILK